MEIMSQIGESLRRPDGPDKLRGRARYAADQKVERLLYGVYVPASIAAGTVAGIDGAKALAQRGVVRVLTVADMPRMKIASALPAASSFMPMQSAEVRYQGQPVAIVLAETLEAAEHAAGLVNVRYTPSAFDAPDMDGTRSPPRATLVDKKAPYLAGEEPEFRKDNVEEALAASARRLNATYAQPSRHNNPMEPSATLAVWQGESLTLYDAVQHGYSVQTVVSQVFGIRPDQVRVVCPHTGGGFGAKGYVWPHQLLTAAAARIIGRPVKIVLSRADMYANVGFQPRMVQQVALGAEASGKLTALRQDVAHVTATSDDFVEAASAGGKSMYSVPAIHTLQRVERCHINMPTAMRAPVEGPATWALNSALDELALAAGLDPLDIRLLNYAETSPADGRPWSSKKLREAYELGAQRFGWRDRATLPKRDGHWRIGRGMADCTMGTFRMASKAEVRLKADGSASVEAGFHDIGSGTMTVMPQIAANVLGLSIDKVTCLMGDTRLPRAGPTYGSSSTLSGGSAVHLAASDARAKLARLAGMDADAVEMKNGRISMPGQAERSIGDVMRAAGVFEIVGSGDWAPAPGLEFEGDGGKGPYAMKTFGAVFVEVAVDPELGLLRLRRVVGAYSAGRIVNPLTARAQMTGGIIWGWGMAAMEQSRHEPRLGRWEAKNLSNIALPVNADIPGAIEIIFVDEFDKHASRIGAKGIGELGATGVAAAVASAVHDAIGLRIRELPITPEKLLA